MENRETLLAFAETSVMTKPRLLALRERYGDLETAWAQMDERELQEMKWHPKSIRSFLEKKETLDLEAVAKKMEHVGAQLLFLEDPDYPALLRTIPDPPVFLYVRGTLQSDDSDLAVVGSRKISVHGKKSMEQVLPPIIQHGVKIVSGLARGVDAYAHHLAVHHGGKTLAVFGSGVDVIYPTENRRLADEIIATGGALLSEFPLATGPNAYHFPKRNRIIAGMSWGTVVVEGEKKSGSIITAHQALEYNREVFAIPGSPTHLLSEGPNRLIQSGEAKLVLQASDILEELNERTISSSITKILSFDTPEEELLYTLLETEEQYLDDLVRKSSLPSSTCSSTLTMLEMKGLARHSNLNYWVRG